MAYRPGDVRLASPPVDTPFLLLLSGPPGAGKSTVGRMVASHFEPSVCLESDWMWTTIVNGHLPPWDSAANRQNRAAISASLAASVRMVDAGYATVVEGVIGPWHWDLVLDEVQSILNVVSYIVLRPTLRVCLDRAGGRRDRVPGIPALRDPEPIQRMWQKFSDLGPLERHAFDNSLIDSDGVLGLLGSGANRIAAAD
jgi:DNA polymerase III delta prime subunit